MGAGPSGSAFLLLFAVYVERFGRVMLMMIPAPPEVLGQFGLP